MFRTVVFAIAVTALGAGAADAQRADQDVAFDAMRSGNILPLSDVMARVRPKTPGELLGSDYDAPTNTYRLKYMNSGSVVWVDVDASTGTIKKRRGR
jgi:hypothetical protein